MTNLISRAVVCLFALYLMTGCSDNFPESARSDCECAPSCPQATAEEIADISIPVEGTQYVYYATYMYNKGEQWKYWGYDKTRNAFDIFDLHQQRYEKSIYIPTEGPGAIRVIYGFLVHSPDSIFIHTNEYRRLYLINHKGSIIQKWELTQPLPNGRERDFYYLATFPQGAVSMHYEADEASMLFMVHNYGFQSKDPYPQEAYHYPYIVEYDLQKNAYTALYGTYPPTYRQDDKCSYELYFPFIQHKGSTFISFRKSHCLYVYPEPGELNSLCSRSAYLPESFRMLPYGVHVKERNLLWRTQGSYISLLSDPYRDLIYRVVAHSQPNKNKSGKLNQKIQAPWSVMVLNSRGKCLGEVKFEAEKFNFFDIHVARQGLVVSTENPFDESNDEEVLRFKVFNIGISE